MQKRATGLRDAKDRKNRIRRGRRGSVTGIRWMLSVTLPLLACAVAAFMAVRVTAAPENPQAEALAETMEAERNPEAGEAASDMAADEGGQRPDSSDGRRGEPLIVIDPGHGGPDEGCTAGGIPEKEINLQIAGRVTKRLSEMGYQVIQTRTADCYLAKEQRVENANRLKADIYVSIHQNTFGDETANGIETWYDGTDSGRDSRRLAQLIHRETLLRTGAQERELRADADFCVTGKTQMPACLIETGFLSNAGERGLLVSPEYQEQIADGIAEGIHLYFHPRTMYLTFDDGPSERSTDQILDVLRERNIKAAFFVIGEYVRKYPDTARRIVQEGHTIGIHCDSHNYEALYADADSYLEDFRRAYETVREVTGVRVTLFRFPGGSINAYNEKICREIIRRMTENGFVYFDWNASLEDAVADARPERFIENARDTALGRNTVVLLAHDRVEGTAACLEGLIDAFPDYRMERLTPESEPVQFVRPWE